MRPYLQQAYLTGVTSINVYKAPASIKILYVGDKFKIDEDTQEYTVTTSDVSSNSSGEATITFTPGLASDYAIDIPLQLPAPRILTSDRRTKINLQNSGLIYFTKFEFDTIYRIEEGDIDTYDSGTKVKITKTAHGLETADLIIMDLPIEYAGVNGTEYAITKIDANSFVINVAFDNDTATVGGSYDIKAPIRVTTSPHDVTWDGETWTGIGGIMQFNSVSEANDTKGGGAELKFTGVDPTILALLLGKAYVSRMLTLWMAHINSDGTISCDVDKDILFKGRMLSDFQVQTTYGDVSKEGTVDVEFKAESRLSLTNTATGLQTNVDSHKQYYDSKLFNQIPKLINKPIKWGKIDTGGGKGGMCLMVASLSASFLYSSLNDHLILDPIRIYRDARMESCVAGHYKETSPKIIEAINKLPYVCMDASYKWIAEQTIQISELVKKGQFVKAETLYFNMINYLEKFIA